MTDTVFPPIGAAHILLIGHVTRDIIRAPGQPDRVQPGGSVYYAGMALRGFGHDVTIVTRVAKQDEVSLLGALGRAGVQIHNLPATQTSCFVNAQGPGGVDDRVQEMRANADAFDDEIISLLRGLSCDVVYFGSLIAGDFSAALIMQLADCFPRAIKLIDAQGPLRARKGNRVIPCMWPDSGRILPICDIVKVDETESLRLTGAPTLDAAAARLAGLGVGQLLITRGGQGALLQTGEGVHQLAAWRPQSGLRGIIDTTGCGDTFLAAYLHAVLHGRAPLAAAHFAAIAATMKLTQFGPLCCGEDAVLAFEAQP